MITKKHIAFRTCIATGEKKDKREMLRLVLGPNGMVEVDIKGKMKGRGANISANIEALDLAFKKKSIERALRLQQGLNIDNCNIIREKFLLALNEKKLRGDDKRVIIKITKEEFEKI